MLSFFVLLQPQPPKPSHNANTIGWLVPITSQFSFAGNTNGYTGYAAYHSRFAQFKYLAQVVPVYRMFVSVQFISDH